jgi:hypothetical protein
MCARLFFRFRAGSTNLQETAYFKLVSAASADARAAFLWPANHHASGERQLEVNTVRESQQLNDSYNGWLKYNNVKWEFIISLCELICGQV